MDVYVFFIFLTTLYGCSGSTADSPCAARWNEEGQGFYCVCNSSYCDTIQFPTRQKTGFLHYKTSNSTPGFNMIPGQFTDMNTSDNIEAKYQFTIKPAVEYQSVIGFGGCLTDSTLLNFNYLPDKAQDKFLKSYFGPTGIEYNMLRVPIGGTDFSVNPYTLDDTPYDEDLSHFQLSEGDKLFRIPLIKKIKDLSTRDVKLLACTWSAPSWMKNNDTNGPQYISEKYNDIWAQYHIKFLDAYAKENLTLWSISGGNEGILIFILMALQEKTLNSTLEFADAQRFWLKTYLKPQLMASGYEDVKFLAMEDQRFMAPYFMERLSRDQEALDAVDGVAVHWYADYFIKPTVLDDIHNLYPDKMILYTESSINAGSEGAVVLGSWYRASEYLYNIVENLGHWTNAYIDWNLALDLNGGPTLSFGIDAPVIINETSGEFYKQPLFYSMGHFSKFIQPGAKRVQVLTDLQTSSTVDGVGKNTKTSLQDLSAVEKLLHGTLSVNVPQAVECLAFSNPDDSFVVMVLNTRNVTVEVKIVDHRVGVIDLPIEENSINTFIYWPST